MPEPISPGANTVLSSSASDRSTSALQRLSTVRYIIATGTIALSLGGVAYLVQKRDPMVEDRRGPQSRRAGRRALQRAQIARMARDVSMMRWRLRLQHSNPDGAELRDRAWRGICTRCGDRMGSVHECRDLAR